MGIKFNQFKEALSKDLKPTKWKMFKFFIKVGFVTVAASYYLHAVNEQIKKNDNPDIISSFESVIKQQYEFIKSPFLSLLSKAEGFEKSFYADNKGYAVGYGYNPTQNSQQYNKSILDYAGVDEATQQKILKNAEKYRNQDGGAVPKEFKDIKFTKEQLDKMAIYAQGSYEKSFYRVLSHKLDNKKIQGEKRIKIIKSYIELPENKKAVLIHMAYKVGEKNLEKYNNFFNNFILYLENPSEKNKEAVANSFTYKYAKNGKMLHDTRVEKIHHDLFMKDMPKISQDINKKVEQKVHKKELSEKEKFDKAMKEVNEQITLNGAMKLLVKGIDKINEKFPEKYKTNNNQVNKNKVTEEYYYEDEEYEQQQGEYYEADSDVQQIIVNGQKINIKGNQSVQVYSDGIKTTVKIK